MDENINQTPGDVKKDVSEFIKNMQKTTPSSTHFAPEDNSYQVRPAVSLWKTISSSAYQEAIKTLRVNIEFSGAEDEIKVLCVTSALPNDGKSTTSYNLACAFAKSGKKTLLIDADMRKSVMMQKVVKAGGTTYGLSNYLVGRAKYDEVICVTNLRTLDILFSGAFPPNPAELLGSSRFSHLIEKVKQEYSVIVIDTPPIGSIIDAAVVAKSCDGVVFVLQMGSVGYRFAQRCKEQMETAGTRILGCVLNNVDLKANKYYGRYYGSYYGHASE